MFSMQLLPPVTENPKDFQWEDVSAAIQIFTVLSQLLSKIFRVSKTTIRYDRIRVGCWFVATIPVFTFFGIWLVYVKSESVLNFYVHFLLELSHVLFLQQHRLDADWTQFLPSVSCWSFLFAFCQIKVGHSCFKGF